MNYRHAYHAGNFADVLKHFVLTLLIRKLAEKDSPFSVIDTHAGIGLYDLRASESTKTGEYQEGITRLMNTPPTQDVFAPYLDTVRMCNPSGVITHYPGSPLIARHLMRPQDRLFLSELHPVDYETLRTHVASDIRIKTFCQDFQISLRSLLPPLHRRGLILIDPPFEKTDEFARVLQGLEQALTRFAHGIFAVWYPLKKDNQAAFFCGQVQARRFAPTLMINFFIDDPDTPIGLNGSGLVIINPPWRLFEQLEESLPILLALLGRTAHARFELQWLVS